MRLLHFLILRSHALCCLSWESSETSKFAYIPPCENSRSLSLKRFVPTAATSPPWNSSQYLLGRGTVFYSTDTRSYFPGVKRPERQGDNSLSCNADVKYVCSYSSTFHVCLHGVDRDFTFHPCTSFWLMHLLQEFITITATWDVSLSVVSELLTLTKIMLPFLVIIGGKLVPMD